MELAARQEGPGADRANRTIRWYSRSVAMALTRHAIRSAPAYDPSMLITPDYEVRLFKPYGMDVA